MEEQPSVTTTDTKQSEVESQIKQGIVPLVQTEKKEQSQEAENSLKFDQKLVDVLPAEARKAFDLAYKDMLADYTRKTQSVSEREKSIKDQAIREAIDSLTPNDIAELSRNPKFVSALQTYLQGQPNQKGLTQEQWEMMTPEEQSAIQHEREKDERLSRVEQAVGMMNANLEHQKLHSKYPAYSQESVTKLYSDFVSGKRQISWEDLYKISDFESAINRAFQLARSERNETINKKFQDSSQVDSTQASSDDEQLKRAKNESVEMFMRRIAERAANRLRGSSAPSRKVNVGSLSGSFGTKF